MGGFPSQQHGQAPLLQPTALLPAPAQAAPSSLALTPGGHLLIPLIQPKWHLGRWFSCWLSCLAADLRNEGYMSLRVYKGLTWGGMRQFLEIFRIILERGNEKRIVYPK